MLGNQGQTRDRIARRPYHLTVHPHLIVELLHEELGTLALIESLVSASCVLGIPSLSDCAVRGSN